MDRVVVLVPVVEHKLPREGLVVVAEIALAVVPEPAGGKVMAAPVAELNPQGRRPRGGLHHLGCGRAVRR